MVKRNKYDVVANRQKQEPDVTHKLDGKDEATTTLWFQSQYTEMVILNRRNKNRRQVVKQYSCYTNTWKLLFNMGPCLDTIMIEQKY